MADGASTLTQMPLIDGFGRQISYLRLSVTDRCDLRCTYCMSEKMQFLPKSDLMTLEELEMIATAFIKRGVRKLRITGGEPLVRKDITSLFARLSRFVGDELDEMTLTTNGTRLAQHADFLAACGVRRVNISLDTLDPEKFAAITRRGSLQAVLDGIVAAQAAGLKIKLNVVALRHQNVDDIPELIAWAHKRKIDVTLIEVMPLGDTGEDRFDQYIPLPEVRKRLEERWTLIDDTRPVPNGGPARFATIAETGGRIGFITPLTNNFCAGCNRVRVTCTGRIYMCLGQDDHMDLKAAIRESLDPLTSLNDALNKALRMKPEKHDFSIRPPGAAPAVNRHMSTTGG